MTKRLITEFFGATRECSLKRRSVVVASAADDSAALDSAAAPKDTPAIPSDPDDTTDASREKPFLSLVKDLLGSEWANRLDDEIRKPYFETLWGRVAKDRSSKRVYPPENLVFNAFKIVPLSKVKVVIVGQDPYHQPRQAMGLSFSVPRGVPLPPSLRNIYKEIGLDSKHGDLTHWAQQGVFMLNTVLTVIDSQPFSHKEYGWSAFTDRVIDLINTHREHVVFLLWGKPAQRKCDSISAAKHCVLKCGHPSPLSQKYFFGCDHFNKCNEYLRKTKQTPIDWKLPP